MRPPSPALLAAAVALILSGCGRTPEPKPTPPAPLVDAIPPAVLDATLAANRRGKGLMERFEYKLAAQEFAEVRRLAPNWLPGSINRAIALLNDTGVQIALASQAGGPPPLSNFDEATELLDGVLVRDPQNLHAHYCRGIIREQDAQIEAAHRDFIAVTDRDPDDAHAWYWAGVTLPNPKRAGQSAGMESAAKSISLYERALAANPYLDTAVYRLAQTLRYDRSPAGLARYARAMELRNKLDPNRSGVPGPGDVAAKVYGSMGKYAEIIDPGAPRKPPAGESPGPRFAPTKPIDVQLAEGHRWVAEADFRDPKYAVIGRARRRFGAAVAAFRADDDDRVDLYLAAAAVGPKGLHDVLLINKGGGKFEDATLRMGVPENRASLGVAAADFDADRRIDLYLTTPDGGKLLRNTGPRYEEITASSGLDVGPKYLAPTARWIDLDQDGDLDLYLVNYTDMGHAGEAFGEVRVPGAPNLAFRNDGAPAPVAGSPSDAWTPLANDTSASPAGAGLSIKFVPWPDGESLSGGVANHTAAAALDLDGDRDVDLALAADGVGLTAVLNDRLGAFHPATIAGASADRASGLLVADFDRDGLSDLAAIDATGKVSPYVNKSTRKPGSTVLALAPLPTDTRRWLWSAATDLDRDGWVDLVGLAADSPMPAWARNEGDRLKASPVAAMAEEVPTGGAYADLDGDHLPDLIAARLGAPPAVWTAAENGQHWLALDFGGRWKVKPQLMRTNPHGWGTVASIEGKGFSIPYVHTTTDAGPAQVPSMPVIGIGAARSADLVRLRWPDGVIQAELDTPADGVADLSENNRKTGSCPVLFTWNGTRFECLGDFLGGGGLGYLVAPGVYGQPDRDEAVAIRPGQLVPVDGVLRLSILEPMDEVAYLDKLTLDVVDRPPGVEATTDERFAPGGNRPSGEVLAWRREIMPIKSADLKGNNVTGVLARRDGKSVDTFKLRSGWVGYAEDHGIVLDFGGRLARFGAADKLVLCLAGGTEYPYSQTNYAASTAGVALKTPVLERQQADGSWSVIDPDPGYPAGMPRLTTLDVTGKLGGSTCVIRLRTNMEIYWDQAFVAVVEKDAGTKAHSLPIARARLGPKGYVREVSADGKFPFWYDYALVDPAPLAKLAGNLTRFGDVAALLRADDDRLCTVGPGDEARVEFDARGLPDLPSGWTRSYVLRSIGYCKDADPFTARSDDVGPLPWKGMPAFPFGVEGERPRDPSYDSYLREYQTRTIAP